MNKPLLKRNVHEIVDPLLRKGDIDNRVYNDETMQLGSKLHAEYQKKQGIAYCSELPLKYSFEREKFILEVEGRADGVILGEYFPIIDEIKTTIAPLEEFYETQKDWHYGQAYFYAYMFLKNNPQYSKIGIQLTYISQLDFAIKKTYFQEKSLEELEKIVLGYVDLYLERHELSLKHKIALKESSKAVTFPFSRFRNGQKEMAKYVYSVSSKGGIFFCEAPTGIGKTMSALFPAVKSFSSNTEKIFYLTAKSTGREAAYEALTKLKEKGLLFRDSYLRAKDKMCFCLGKACNPDDCPFCVDYYEKLRDIIEEEERKCSRFTIDYVKKLAYEKGVCPFELQLDLSLLSDIVVGDFNYFFDPIVKLDRYFGEEIDSSKYVVLVDEAHNLIERSRNMYSSSISLAKVKEAKNSLKGPKKIQKIKRYLTKIQKFLETENLNSLEDKEYQSLPEEFKTPLLRFLDNRSDLLKEKDLVIGNSYKELSRELYRFKTLLEDYSKNSVLYFSKKEKAISLLSLDPSFYLHNDLKKVKAASFFSATLSPISFYMDSLNGESSPYLLLPSPYSKDNFTIYIAPKISTRYKDRANSYKEVAEYLKEFVDSDLGNYFIYCPSYEYLENIKGLLRFDKAKLFIQEAMMNEDEMKAFLSLFQEKPKESHVGLLVIGGAFAEGVDLVGDRLSGVAIIGVGLPMVSFEKEAIKKYFLSKGEDGFAYAYKDPGINKVMQALGRVIRSENDVGKALLIDDRYLKAEYRDTISRRYPNYKVVFNSKELAEELKKNK